MEAPPVVANAPPAPLWRPPKAAEVNEPEVNAAEVLGGDVFQKADKNGNGTLSKKELAVSFSSLLGPGYQTLMKQFASFDADGDGELSRAEFVKLYATLIDTPGVAKAMEAPPVVANAPPAPPSK